MGQVSWQFYFDHNGWWSWYSIPLCSKLVLPITTDVFSKLYLNLAWVCTQVIFPSQSLRHTSRSCPNNYSLIFSDLSFLLAICIVFCNWMCVFHKVALQCIYLCATDKIPVMQPASKMEVTGIQTWDVSHSGWTPYPIDHHIISG